MYFIGNNKTYFDQKFIASIDDVDNKKSENKNIVVIEKNQEYSTQVTQDSVTLNNNMFTYDYGQAKARSRIIGYVAK